MLEYINNHLSGFWIATGFLLLAVEVLLFGFSTIIFLFAGLAAGIASGAYAFGVAIVGTLGFAAASLILYYSPLGPDNFFDGMLRFNMPCNDEESKQLENVLRQNCKAFSLVTLREIEQGQRLDYAYHIKLRRGKTYEQFLHEVKKLRTVSGVNLMLQEATVDL